jgi:hypothetical protein
VRHEEGPASGEARGNPIEQPDAAYREFRLDDAAEAFAASAGENEARNRRGVLHFNKHLIPGPSSS